MILRGTAAAEKQRKAGATGATGLLAQGADFLLIQPAKVDSGQGKHTSHLKISGTGFSAIIRGLLSGLMAE
jgi:hypothetical protein